MSDDRILLKRSGIPSEVPLAAQLEFGELAINYADGAIFTKMVDGVVRNISGAVSSNNTIYVRINGDDNNSGADEAQAKRTIRAGLNASSPNTTIDIGPGMFLEDNPLIMPQRTTIHGVDQRITSIIPKNLTEDMIWVSTGCYVTGLAFRGHFKPSFCIAFPGNVQIGTAQSSGTSNNTIVLDPTKAVQGPGLENYYREMRITLTGGTGSGQSRNIVSYNTESRTATVDNVWDPLPDNTSAYLIDIEIPDVPSPNRRYSAHITASPYLYNMASVVADALIAASGSSLSISNGPKTLTIDTGLNIAAGRWVRVLHDPFNFMVGTVTSYNPSNGELIVQVEKNQRIDIQSRTTWSVYYVCGSGMEMDGFKAAGLRSMVSAQFTQFNQGGDAVVIKNMGYAQLVSIYAINCDDGFIAESGGTASMGNCNVNFGNRGLVANGVGPLLMTASAGFIYNESKCERDTGLIVDSILQDLSSDANTQSVFAGLQYWNQSGSTVDVLPLPQKAPTINTFNYISTVAQNVVQGIVHAGYQGGIAQDTVAASPATAAEAARIASLYSTIINIINNGTNGVTDIIVPNSITPNTDSNAVNAYTLLQANKEYLKAEANAYVSTVETSISLNTALQTKCSRDVGFITDSVSYDLSFGGNKQAVQSGVYYYGYSNISAIINQEPQTIDAYNYIKLMTSYIVTNTAVPRTYQTAVTQSFSANVATSTQSSLANNLIDTITDIISQGPSNYLQFRFPIPLTINTDSNQINAVTQLKNNRGFIQKEVIAYLGNVWTSNNQTGFTINVSNVFACTDPRFSITEDSTPYLGLVMNIEGERELDIQAGLGYSVGETLNLAFIDPDGQYTDYIEGTLTSFDLSTTRATITISNVVGQTGNIHTNWVVNTTPVMTTNGRFRQEVILGIDAGEFSNVQVGGQFSFIVDTSLEIEKYITILAANTVGAITTLTLDRRIREPLLKDTKLYFYQKSSLAASGQTFEFVGSGTSVFTALPRAGGDILQANETVSSNGGIVYFTSTDQFGNFRIGEDLLINFNTGTLSGRAFTRSLFAQITPFVLALDS